MARPLWDYRGMSVRFYGYCTGSERQPCNICAIVPRAYNLRTIFPPSQFPAKILRSLGNPRTISAGPPLGARAGIVQTIYDVSTGYGLTIFSNSSNFSLRQNRRGCGARKPVRCLTKIPRPSPAIARRLHGNGDTGNIRAP